MCVGGGAGVTDLHKKFAEMDTDHDGDIDREEWIRQGYSAEVFDRLDVDHSQHLSTEEWAAGSWLPESDMGLESQRNSMPSPKEMVPMPPQAQQSKVNRSSAETAQPSGAFPCPSSNESKDEKIRRLEAQLKAQAEQLKQSECEKMELQSRCPRPACASSSFHRH